MTKNFARRLYVDLQAKGVRCWLDEKGVSPGDYLHDQTQKIHSASRKAFLDTFSKEHELLQAFRS